MTLVIRGTFRDCRGDPGGPCDALRLLLVEVEPATVELLGDVLVDTGTEAEVSNIDLMRSNASRSTTLVAVA